VATYATLEVEDQAIPEGEGSIRIITINQPKALNALSEAVVAELTAVVEDSGRTSTVRGVLITGAGKAFVAGADITAMAGMTPEQALVFSGRGHAFGELLTALPVPTLAAVNGFALGGGCELALACDFIYASDKAKLGQPEVKLGVIPGFGGTQRLARRVGLARALELCMTGDMIDAAEALRIGLVSAVVPNDEFGAFVREKATKATSFAPLTAASIKANLNDADHVSFSEALDREADRHIRSGLTEDSREAAQAFLEKRPPTFHGR
jgi:enoyl-CoA hydratase